MNRKCLVLALLLLVTSMASTSLVQAANYERNNDKFEPFSVSATSKVGQVLYVEREYVPSTDYVNKYTLTYGEKMLTYQITIGDDTYNLGTDFTYKGDMTMVYLDPVFATGSLTSVTSFRAQLRFVEYTFDFSACPGGLDGELTLHMIANEGGRYINSICGTDDLQNVQVKAVASTPTIVSGTVYYAHQGIVLGWPE